MLTTLKKGKKERAKLSPEQLEALQRELEALRQELEDKGGGVSRQGAESSDAEASH